VTSISGVVVVNVAAYFEFKIWKTLRSVLFTNPPRILSTFVVRVVNEPKTTYAEYPGKRWTCCSWLLINRLPMITSPLSMMDPLPLNVVTLTHLRIYQVT